jgi:two-component system C4-dicarboxylate transport response regulator DctD
MPSVVLVEDDEDVRHGCAQALELAGFTVHAFGSVEAARRASSRTRRWCCCAT